MKPEQLRDIKRFTAIANSIAWEGCHKIYILLDENQTALMREYGYDCIVTKDQATADEMTDLVVEWYNDSCGLRFVSAVITAEDRNDGFITVIGQFEDEEEGEVEWLW